MSRQDIWTLNNGLKSNGSMDNRRTPLCDHLKGLTTLDTCMNVFMIRCMRLCVSKQLPSDSIVAGKNQWSLASLKRFKNKKHGYRALYWFDRVRAKRVIGRILR